MSIETHDILQAFRAAGLAFELRGDETASVSEPVATDAFDGSQLTLYTGTDAETVAKFTDPTAGLVILSSKLREKLDRGPFAFVDDVRLAFIIAARLFVPPVSGGIHPSAVVHPDARLGGDVIIGANAVIGAAEIGDGCQIGALSTVADCVRIGRNAILMSGVHVGDPGMGAVTDQNGDQQLFPHFESVVLEDLVVLGTGTVVHRGELKPTVIRRNTILSASCFVAHNCVVGAGSFLSPHTILGGSARVGDRCFLGMGCCIRDHVEIADEVTVGMNSTVTRSCLTKGSTIMSEPARVIGSVFGEART